MTTNDEAPWWWPDTDDEGYIVLPDPSDGSSAREAYEKVASALLYYHDTIEQISGLVEKIIPDYGTSGAFRESLEARDAALSEIERLHERMNRGLS